MTGLAIALRVDLPFSSDDIRAIYDYQRIPAGSVERVYAAVMPAARSAISSRRRRARSRMPRNNLPASARDLSDRFMSACGGIHYVGLDVSLRQTSACVVDRTASVVREGMVDGGAQLRSDLLVSAARGALRRGRLLLCGSHPCDEACATVATICPVARKGRTSPLD